MKAQPRSARDKWQSLQGKPRIEYVQTLRQEERKRREQWHLAARFWQQLHDGRPPATCRSELGDEDREGVEQYLMPMLSDAEKQRLRTAEKQWPGYLMTLVELADRHPLALLSATGPRTLHELPHAVREHLENSRTKKGVPYATMLLREQKKPWPEFAQTVVTVYQDRLHSPLPRELWACNEQCLLPPMQQYVTDLKLKLTDKEKQRLHDAENKWPAYPIAIQELAQAHELPTPPWNTALSGPRERWEAYRTTGATDMLAVPRQVLQEFALTKLEPAKLAQFKKLPPPQMWQKLHTEFQRRMQGHTPPKMPHFEPRDKGKSRRFRHEEH